MNQRQRELAELIVRHTGQDGSHASAIPALFLFRQSSVTTPNHGVQRPSFCVIVQGKKAVWLAQEQFTYSPSHYLVASVDLPVVAQVVEASEDMPYLALKLELTPREILEILGEKPIHPIGQAKRAMFVNPIEPPLLDAVTRLVRLLDTPDDIDVLAPIYKREILYRVLQGPYGDVLKQIAIEGSHAYRIRDVIEYIKQNYHRPIRIEDLADIAHMSVSTLHRHFKEVTAMSPIQFQKQLRLQKARHLLLAETIDAAEVAFQVGYESPSQFNREYSRMFGLPPKKDAKRLREENNTMKRQGYIN